MMIRKRVWERNLRRRKRLEIINQTMNFKLNNA